MSNRRKITAARRVQYGALPYRLAAGSRPQFMLVTSRETRRWIMAGAKGPAGEVVRLEGTVLGCRRFTSKEALQRFTDRLTPRLDANKKTGGKGSQRMK